MDSPDPNDERLRCGRCAMTFEIGPPRGDRHVCPDCKLPFWAVVRPHCNTVRVGMATEPMEHRA